VTNVGAGNKLNASARGVRSWNQGTDGRTVGLRDVGLDEQIGASGSSDGADDSHLEAKVHYDIVQPFELVDEGMPAAALSVHVEMEHRTAWTEWIIGGRILFVVFRQGEADVADDPSGRTGSPLPALPAPEDYGADSAEKQTDRY